MIQVVLISSRIIWPGFSTWSLTSCTTNAKASSSTTGRWTKWFSTCCVHAYQMVKQPGLCHLLSVKSHLVSVLDTPLCPQFNKKQKQKVLMTYVLRLFAEYMRIDDIDQLVYLKGKLFYADANRLLSYKLAEKLRIILLKKVSCTQATDRNGGINRLCFGWRWPVWSKITWLAGNLPTSRPL